MVGTWDTLKNGSVKARNVQQAVDMNVNWGDEVLPETALLNLSRVKEKWYQVISGMNGVLDTPNIQAHEKESWQGLTTNCHIDVVGCSKALQPY